VQKLYTMITVTSLRELPESKSRNAQQMCGSRGFEDQTSANDINTQDFRL